MHLIPPPPPQLNLIKAFESLESRISGQRSVLHVEVKDLLP